MNTQATKSWPTSTWVQHDFLLIDHLLRHPRSFLWELKHQLGLAVKTRAMLVVSCTFMTLYGSLLGATHSIEQMISSAIKLPLVFLLTLLICAPAMHMLNILLGSKQTLQQSIALVLLAITITATILFALAPITLLFVLTTPDAYQAFKLLNVLFFITSGSIGVFFLAKGMWIVNQPTLDDEEDDDDEKGSDYLSLLSRFCIWLVVYGFAFSQVTWTLRPFVGFPNAGFELLRQDGGNVYSNIFNSLGELLGFWIIQ